MIKRFDKWELHFYKVLLSFRESFIVHDKDFYFFSFLSLITVFYFIEADSWLKLKGSTPRKRIALSFVCILFIVFRLMVLVILFFVVITSSFKLDE